MTSLPILDLFYCKSIKSLPTTIGDLKHLNKLLLQKCENLNELLKPLESSFHYQCRNSILRECEDETHTPEMGTWESSETLETSEFDCRGQNTSHWGVIYTIGKLSKCRCRKWTRMSHLDICSTSYGKKKNALLVP
jgi:hypothetical protein